MYLARATVPEIRNVKHRRSIRLVLFEDVWEIALQNPLPTSLVPPKLLAKIQAAPRDTGSARAQRELICTPREAQQLLRIYRVAASAYAVLGDIDRLQLAADGARLVSDALRTVARRREDRPDSGA